MSWLATVVLAATVMEAAVLLVWGQRIGRGIGPADTVAMLAPGFALTGALWLSLSGHGVPAIGAALVAALVAHLADLRRRLGTRPRRT